MRKTRFWTKCRAKHVTTMDGCQGVLRGFYGVAKRLLWCSGLLLGCCLLAQINDILVSRYDWGPSFSKSMGF